jgi:hypothetical protein
MSALAFYTGILQLAVVAGSLAFTAVLLRQHLLPDWKGPPGRLVEAVVAIALLVFSSQLLGVVGLMQGWAILAFSLLCAALSWWVLMRPASDLAADGSWTSRVAERSSPPAPPAAPHGWWLALLVAFVTVAQWAAFTSYSLDFGVLNFDSVWYHLPFSAEMFQTGSTITFLKTETVFTNWFYPQNSELIHAVSMALTGRDFVSVFLNMGWLALALLASWCIGRPYGRPHLTLIAAAVLLTTHSLVAREPGTAKNDIVVIALILSAMAIMFNRSADPADGSGRVAPGWAMASAGLAVGLAVGTKLTALAPAAMMTFAVLYASHRGTRLRASAVWFGSGLVGGGFWYLRNLITTGNPVPQVGSIGPIGLPAPEVLQQGRPDYTVLHYIGDLDIWREYFLPGLSSGFGVLWPLIFLLAVVGLGMVWWRGPGRLTRTHGFAALVAIAAYFVTPLSAAGPEGSPDAFAINLRFLVPALAMALVLIPLVSWFSRPRLQLALGLLLTFTFFVTGYDDAIWRESGRLFGVAFALVTVFAPAMLWRWRDRFSGGGTRAIVMVSVAAVALGLLFAAWPLSRHYSDQRYAEFEAEAGLAEPYRWADGIQDARIGLAGTTAGFRQYGFFGNDLSNEVVYIGREAPHGGFDVIRDCAAFRRAVNRADVDYLVTSPFLNFNGDRAPIYSPEADWVAGDPAVERVTPAGEVQVWRLSGPLDPGRCPADAPGPEATPGLVNQTPGPVTPTPGPVTPTPGPVTP